MTSPSTLSAATRSFIVLVALLQGLLLYLLRIGPFANSGLEVCGYVIVLSVPTMMILSVQQLGDARFWQHAVGIGAIYLLLAWWAGWSATGAPDISASAVLWPFGASLAIALFIALPYLQCRLDSGRWRASYDQLFEHGWQNALTLLLTAVFVGICWAVLGLCAVLFKLIGIQFFADLFTMRSFIHLASGIMIGLGVLVGRTQQRPVQVARQILFAIFKGLLPLVAVIAILFVISLPFTGLDALWRTRSATLILMCLIAVMVLFVNAVYQDGSGEPPYPRWLRRVVEAALLILPIYAMLGLYALALRIGQYGWTAERLWAVIASVVLTAYAFGYAWAALRPRLGWLHGLMRVNVIVSLVAMAFAVAANSLVLDPHRLTVNDQLARLREGRTPAEKFDLSHLRFQNGRRGYEALQSLRSDPKFAGDKQSAKLERVLKMKTPWEYRMDDRVQAQADTVAAALRHIQIAPGADQPDTVWLQALIAQRLPTPDCLNADSQCVLMTPDLDRSGRNDYLLCNTVQYGATCFVYSLEDGLWDKIGRSYLGDRAETVAPAMRAGQVKAVPRRWSDFQFGDDGKLVQFELDSEEERAKTRLAMKSDKTSAPVAADKKPATDSH
ncbi:DUF4153 domain-containing protein [Lysobacter capsici]|uniref:DUF4153 domain-containing protein n=1 Tax=Lysobacter capsici TaxID=435897 RepID=UPI00287BBB84|nr:DUF4153 domain-containing protein [Lysobacter capsici]WND81887.1 DUF4153 domain-containing protein [Lysobacter capsici]WND87083.1 DUF4153 domain-containing protein [Lysobacter capsici]